MSQPTKSAKINTTNSKQCSIFWKNYSRENFPLNDSSSLPLFRMDYVVIVKLLLLACPTAIAFAQSAIANEGTSRAPSWSWPYLQVYPPVSADEAAGETKSLYFALMMSFSGNTKTSGTIPGVQAALDGINGDSTLLPGYKLHYTLTDSQVS